MRNVEFDDDRDSPQECDLDYDDENDDEEDSTFDCPECGRTLHEDAIHCPHCGHWTEGGDSPAERRSRGWFWPVLVACLVAVILVVWSGLRR